jgi:hypothetical protein
MSTEYKPYSGPKWSRGVNLYERVRFGEVIWECIKKEDRGRVVHWENDAGLKARTEATPDHPDYPKDPDRVRKAPGSARGSGPAAAAPLTTDLPYIRLMLEVET